jgi:hypothetical protein
LLVIVPDSDTLEVEARVANKDIGFVRSGQSVRVKLDAFLFTRYGTLPGRVLSLSKDAVEVPGSEPVYMARIQLDAATFTYNYIGSEHRIYLRQFPSGALNLDHLDVVFTDPLGRLIEFNGADHSIFLRIAYEAR